MTPTARRLEWLGMLVVAGVMTYAEPKSNQLLHYGIALVFTVCIWYANRALLLSMQTRYPRPDQTLRRLLIQGPLHVLLTVVISLVVQGVIIELLLQHACTPNDRVDSVTMSLLPTAFVVLVYESRFFFQQWRHNAVRVEQLARAQAQSQLEALRSQVDPHFLFNSLNTLAALIDEDADAAQEYLTQLADVYRYVLLAREKDTVTLEEELAFVDAYLALNKARFRENLRVENTITGPARHRRVAPLSVQTLVENALKHNVISREHPLALRLESLDADTIQVSNTVRLKTTLTPGTRLGLRNLVSRYALLSERPVAVQAGEVEWAVALPLL